MRSLVLLPLALALALAGGCDAQTTPRAGALPTVAEADRLRGLVLDAREDPGPDVMSRFSALGANVICVVPYAFMPDARAPELRWTPDARWFSENADAIRRLSREARGEQMRLAIKPQVWLRGAEWPGTVEMASVDEWRAWEAAYHAYVLHWAAIAAETDAAAFVIGSELDQAATLRPDFWRALATDVRAVYGGTVTYAANWDRAADIGFWPALDAIGVQAYFPLSDASDPTQAQLASGWAPHLAGLRGLARLNDRPVLFTEVGYRSAATAAARPWLWPENDDAPADPELQARLYQTFFDAVWPQPWLMGALVWKVHPDDHPRPTGFTPLGKPAEAVLRAGFSQ